MADVEIHFHNSPACAGGQHTDCTLPPGYTEVCTELQDEFKGRCVCVHWPPTGPSIEAMVDLGVIRIPIGPGEQRKA